MNNTLIANAGRACDYWPPVHALDLAPSVVVPGGMRKHWSASCVTGHPNPGYVSGEALVDFNRPLSHPC